MRVAYLGPDGTVSHEALMAVPGADAFELVPEPTLHDAIVAVHDGTVDRALVPIENALEGAVNPTLDAIAFETDDVVIVGELRHPVHLCLLAGRPLALDAIETVLSHPQASAQCARFLRTELPEARVVAAPSTADAVRQAIAAGDRRLLEPAVDVEEEHVLAETLAARARLDPGEVDPAGGELEQAAHEPARARRAGAPEHERRLEPLAAVRLRACAGDPDEARLVAVVVLDVEREDRRPVEPSRVPRPEGRRGVVVVGGRLADGVGRRGRGDDPGVRQLGAQEAGALGAGLRV